MAHIIVEYTDNLSEAVDMPALLQAIAAKMADTGGVFPVGGVRVRGVRLTEYAIADGEADYAFVHLTAKIAVGRPADFKTRFFGELFELVKARFAALMQARPVALSLYVEEVGEAASWKANTIHTHMRAAAQ